MDSMLRCSRSSVRNTSSMSVRSSTTSRCASKMLASFAPMASAIFACISMICARVTSSACSNRAHLCRKLFLGDDVVRGLLVLAPEHENGPARDAGGHSQPLESLLETRRIGFVAHLRGKRADGRTRVVIPRRTGSARGVRGPPPPRSRPGLRRSPAAWNPAPPPASSTP